MRRVVITGMGAVTPIGNDVPSMWDSMMNSRHGIAPITLFDTTNFASTLAAEVKDFDSSLYMNGRDNARYDRFALFGVGAASQAVEDSGVISTVDPTRIGVYFSSGMGGFGSLVHGNAELESKGSAFVPPFTVPATMTNSAAAYLAIKYNCKNACMSIATACASSADAIGEALRAIRHGYADVIIAGGCDAVITPVGVASFITCKALSRASDPDRASIPFDAERSGFIMGEGGGAFVLEEYEHAVSRGAKIYAEVAGYAATCDAFHITRPNSDADAATRAMRGAIAESGLPESGAIYVNAHGTSTKLNDEIETLAIKQALGETRAYKSYVSSTKSMTGHLLGGAGAVEAVASVMALNTGMVPPTVGYRTPDPACDLNIGPNNPRKQANYQRRNDS